MRFLADESCDFAVVRALRDSGPDVIAITELSPGAKDEAVLAVARSEARILLTEDKDFGSLAYAGGHETSGVILIRFRADARRQLGPVLVSVIAEVSERLRGAFVVVESGRAESQNFPSRVDTPCVWRLVRCRFANQSSEIVFTARCGLDTALLLRQSLTAFYNRY